MPEARSNRAAALRKVPLFGDLSDKELSFLAALEAEVETIGWYRRQAPAVAAQQDV